MVGETLEPRWLFAAAPANDLFANRILLSGSDISTAGSNVGATKEPGEPDHVGNRGGASVWWAWTAPASGAVTIDTAGSSFDTTLATYTGTSVSALTVVPGGSNDDSSAGGTTTSRVSFVASAGAVYQIAVDGFFGVTGSIALHVHLAPPQNLPSTVSLTSAVGPLGAVVQPSHIVIVLEEDRAANAIGDPRMPYTNALAQSGLVYSNSHGVNNESDDGEMDYLALYSGSTQGIIDDGRDYTWAGPNLAKSLFDAGLSFAGYSESLPADGSQVSEAADPADPDKHPDAYIRAYNPMAQFTDVGQVSPGVARPNSTVNKTFASFPTTAAGYDNLPTVSFVIPNLLHNTHGSNEAPYTDASSDYYTLRANADAWLASHLDGYLQWAKSNNSLLIVTGDEGDRGNPWIPLPDRFQEGVTTVVNGDPRLFAAGTSSEAINQYRLLRTIEQMCNLPLLGDSTAVGPVYSNAAGKLAPLGPSGQPSLQGQTVTFAANVTPGGGASGPATGTVQFNIDGTDIGGPVPLINGSATSPALSTLLSGSHAVLATYSGDPTFASATSSSFSHVVQGTATSTTIVSSQNPAIAGAPIFFTANVSEAGKPVTQGFVQFQVDGANLGSPVAVANGIATSSTTNSLPLGTRYVTASYLGDGDLGPSTSAPFSQVITPVNDAFANRLTLSGTAAAATGRNVGASKEAGEPNHAGKAGGKSVWWTWTAPTSGTVTINTTGSNFDTLLAAYTGASVGALLAVASNDNDGSTTTSKISFAATSGVTYQIALDGLNGATGNFSLNLTFTASTPKPPTSVSATDGVYRDRVRVTWAAAAAATGYEVWRGTSSNSSKATRINSADVAGTTFDDLTAVSRVVYWYWIKSKNGTVASGFSTGNSGYRS